jgi:hypothetical protein
MSTLVDASQVLNISNQTATLGGILDLSDIDTLSVSATILTYTTQSAAVMASATNVTAAVQSTAVLTVSNFATIAANATITINGTVYTNGVDWTAATSNNATATSIAAIATLPAGITASANNAVVTFTNTAYGTVGNSNTITSSDAAKLTITASPFSNGVDALFTKTAHGLLTGVVGQMTTSNTLPSGLSTSTNYYVIRKSSSTFALASTLAKALAGTIDEEFTTTGTGNQTFTPTTGSSTIALYESVNGTNFVAISGDTVTDGAGTTIWHLSPVYSRYLKVLFTPVAGAANFTITINARNNTCQGQGAYTLPAVSVTTS